MVGEVGEVGRRSLASSAAVILPARGTCSPGGTSGVAGGGGNVDLRAVQLLFKNVIKDFIKNYTHRVRYNN